MSRPSWRARVSAAAPGALLALTCAIIAWSPAKQADPAQSYVAVGYNEIVDRIFVPMGWLAHNSQDAETSGHPQPVVSLTSRAWAVPAAADFMQKSYLRGDIEADNPALWLLRGDQVVGIDPLAHTLLGPLGLHQPWQGNIEYRPSTERTILIQNGAHRFPLEAASSQRPTDWQVSIGGETIVEGEARDSFAIVDHNAPVARVRRIGTSILVETYTRHPYYRAFVVDPFGNDRPADSGAATADYLLQPGAVLRFIQKGSDRPLGASFALAATADLSLYRPFGKRQNDPAADTLAVPLTTALDSVADRGLLRVRSEALRLTLDRALQADAQRQLEKVAGSLLGITHRRFRAAATVMDTTNGEILALASFPTPNSAAIAGVEQPPTWLTQNQNFTALPIGSMAKVPFSAAILTRYPRLAGLRITVSRPMGDGLAFPSVMGVPLGKPVQDEPAGDRQGVIDFVDFLRHSSNKYAASLLMLAASSRADFAPDGPRLGDGDVYWLDGERRTRGPRNLFCPTSHETCLVSKVPASLSNFLPGDGEAWPTLMARLFDLPGLARSDGPGWDFAWWAELTRGLPPELSRRFAAASPEVERLGLDAVADPRNDYVALIIGNGKSRWTTVKLAEIYSRVVTDRRITAHLLLDPSQHPPAAPLGVDPDARRLIRTGMQAVLSHQGTGAKFAIPHIVARSGETICAFAKTGTPTISTPVRSPLNREINSLIAAGLLTMRENRLAVARDGNSALPRALAQLYSDAPRALPAVGVPLLARAITAINAARAAGQDDGLVFDTAGRLAGTRADQEDESANRGSGFTVVLGRFRGDCLKGGRPVRALTIATNIQSRDTRASRPGPNAAIEFANGLFTQGSAALAWLNGSP